MSQIIKAELEYKDSKSDKVYIMKRDNDNSNHFTVEYGRRNSNLRKAIYPASMWDSTLKQKLKKGYILKPQKTSETMTEYVITDPSIRLITDSTELYDEEYNGEGESVIVLAKNGTKVRVKELSDIEKNKFLDKILFLKTKVSSAPLNENVMQFHADIDFIEDYLKSSNFITKKSLQRLIEISTFF